MKALDAPAGILPQWLLALVLVFLAMEGRAAEKADPQSGPLKEARQAYYQALREPGADLTPWLAELSEARLVPEMVEARQQYLSGSTQFDVIGAHWYSNTASGQVGEKAVLLHVIYLGLPEESVERGERGKSFRFRASFRDVWFRDDGRWKVLWLTH
jgi:hypothetical protein